MRIFIPLLLGMALSLGACSEAQTSEQSPVAASAPTAQVVPAKADSPPISRKIGNWLVQSNASHLRFSTTQEGEAFSGEFPRFDAVINFNPQNVAAATVMVKVPLTFVEAGSTDRNSTLPGKLWFDIKKHPIAVFESADISRTGEGTYLANGTLTLKGVSRPMALPFTLKFENGQAVMESRTTLDRTLWNIGEAPWNTDEWVGTNVELDIKVTANNPN